jgi:transposase-like protein
MEPLTVHKSVQKGQDSDVETCCPSCDAGAVYKYGKVRTGKQRYLCLICGMQFTLGRKRPLLKGKPLCPECSRPMNVFKLEGDILRFRCSAYPECKTHRKYRLTEETDELLHS